MPKSMKVYFDNSASTKVYEEVITLMGKVMREDYGNASSLHHMGFIAERYIKEAGENIADTLKVLPKEIIFTSGGTEANNLALIGGARSYQRRGKHIISTAIEHPAVYKPLDFLTEQGFEITILPVDYKGHIDIESLRLALREDTILVSIMMVNNEIGTIAKIREIAECIHKENPQTLFHVDAIQGYGKIRIYPKKLGIDMLSVSAHKIHGPKGVGFLYIDKKIKLCSILFGGGQQRGLRSGTMDVPAIAGMGLACKMAYTDFEEKIENMIKIKNFLLHRLSALKGVHLHSYPNLESAPHIISASIEDIRSEVLLHALEQYDIYISSGSACSSNHPGISGVIKSIGVPSKLWDSTIRISLSIYSTLEEAEYFIQTLENIMPMLRKFTRKFTRK